MAAVNFPNNPSVNDTHTSSGSTWKWDGTVWQRLGVAGPQGAQGVQGAAGSGGAAGAQGAQGVQGAAGSGGAAGAQGAQGVQGATGSATINNNADNRLITGSGTAGELNAEANITCDGTRLMFDDRKILLGTHAGYSNPSDDTFCVGYVSGYSNPGNHSISIGSGSGYSNAGDYSINLGKSSGYGNSGDHSINIGEHSGYSNAGEHSVNIGKNAGYQSGGKYSVNIGYNAGNMHSVNSNHNVAIGYEALKNEGSNKYCIGIGASCYLPIKGENTGASDNQLVIGVGHTAWIVGTKNYNIGLGVTNPSSKLQVQEGDIKIQNNAGGTDGLFMRNATSTFAWTGEHENTAIPNGAIGMIITNSDVATNKSASLLEFRTYRNSATANPGVVYIGAVDIGDGSTHSSDMIFALKDGSATVIERMRINHDGKLLVGSDTLRTIGGSGSNGRVQIEGTSTNLSSLAIINNQNNTNASHLNFGKTRGTSTGAVTTVADGDNLGMIRWSGADGTDLENSTAVIKAIVNGTVSGNTIPTDIVFQTSATSGSAKAERLRITSAGKIGIGCDPDYTLDVRAASGDVWVSARGGTNQGFQVRKSDNTLRGYAGNGAGVNLGADDFAISAPAANLVFQTGGTAASNERLRITSAGLVGIDCTPSKKLQVKGIDVAFRLESTAATGRIGMEFYDSSAQKGYFGYPSSSNDHMSIQQNEAADLYFYVNGGERLRIDSSGRVLIGCSSSSYAYSSLVVEGNATFGAGTGTLQLQLGTANPSSQGSGLGEIRFTDSNEACGAVIKAESDAAWSNGSSYPSYLSFKTTAASATSSTERLRITSDGNLIAKGSLSTGDDDAAAILIKQTQSSVVRNKAFTHFFSCNKGAGSGSGVTKDIMTVSGLSNFHQAMIVVEYGTRLQAVSDSVSGCVHRAYGINRFNGGTLTVTETNAVYGSTNSLDDALINIEIVSNTEYRVRLTFKSNLGSSSFASGMIRGFALHDHFPTISFAEGVGGG